MNNLNMSHLSYNAESFLNVQPLANPVSVHRFKCVTTEI